MSSAAGRSPRNVHVLFVHGVGKHSHLSSLLQAYQALRSNLRSPEAPIAYEDPIPDWTLDGFDDENSAPCLRLVPKDPAPGETQAVYLYEVNYSALAGVLRSNQPLDITRLFVGLDLAVNVAREALRKNPPSSPAPGAYAIDHAELAKIVQKLTGVLVAATVPVLGIPSLIFRAYTKSLVATFTRFFEDIATFALDKNGEELIAAHVDRTVDTILSTGKFAGAGDAEYDPDVFVIAAHSLGTVVSHHYIVRHAAKGRPAVPARVLTYGSPIGLVCWMWLFLDFQAMRFDPNQLGSTYFCWTPLTSPALGPSALSWTNVVNYMDPIATAFPVDYLNLDLDRAENAHSLSGGAIDHKFIRTGALFSAGSAHTSYFDDLDFREIVGRTAGLRAERPDAVATKPADEHWRTMIRDLMLLRVVLSFSGIAAIAAYVGVIATAYSSWWPLALLPAMMWPPLTIGALAFCQRLLFGWPTKRTSEDAIASLRWSDASAFPYRLRHSIGLAEPDPLGGGPRWYETLGMWIVSFVPSLLLMLVPLYLGFWASGSPSDPWQLIWSNKTASIAMLGAFMIYFVLFAMSELVAHWRRALLCTTHTSPA